MHRQFADAEIAARHVITVDPRDTAEDTAAVLMQRAVEGSLAYGRGSV